MRMMVLRFWVAMGLAAALALGLAGGALAAALPAPVGSSLSLNGESVSCASPGDCTAVGAYADSSGVEHGLLLSESAGGWAPGAEARLPANAAAVPFVSLNSVSCSAAGDCSAVGTYTDRSGHEQGLLLSEDSGTWTTGIEAALPANAAPDPRVGLGSVSCASPGDCSAVGTYTDSSGGPRGLLLSESSGTWATGVEAALPANAGPNPDVGLRSVSCASPGDCSAVGYYIDSSGHGQGLFLSETAGTWARGITATPYGNVVLNSVSCASPGDCGAVGYYNDSSDVEHGLLFTESSGTWATGVEAALPADAATGAQVVELSSVSCASAGDCSAVGIYGSPDDTHGLLLSETAGTWATGVEATLPANAESSLRHVLPLSPRFEPDVWLGSVSCASAGDCSAVGYYTDSSGVEAQGLLLTESSGTWGPGVEATLPPDAKPHISGASLHPKSFKAKKGTKLSLTLSAVAKVKVVITQTGHKLHGVCKARAKKGKKCQVKVTTRTFNGVVGSNRFKLKLRGLKPGSYTAIVTASNTTGTSGKTRLTFRIRR